MKTRENLIDLSNHLRANESLLRLLYYLPLDSADDPLDPSKANILDLPNASDLVKDLILTTPRSDDLVNSDPRCRLLVYMGQRQLSPLSMSYQQVHIDIFCPYSCDAMDQRLAWICDTVNGNVHDRRITGIRKLTLETGEPIVEAPVGFAGYRLIYTIGSGNV